jgi:myb proto-oncogene protein
MEAVKKHAGESDAIAAMVPGRTKKQVRQRWIKTVDQNSGKNPGKWTPEEDAKLTEAVKQHGNNWRR